MTYKVNIETKQRERMKFISAIRDGLFDCYLNYKEYDNGDLNDLSAYMDMSEGQVWDKLRGYDDLTLDNIAKLAYYMGYRVNVSFEKMNENSKEVPF